MSWHLPWGGRRDRPAPRPVTITIRAGPAQPAGPEIPGDFTGLSFERGPLNPDHLGVPGYLFSPANEGLITLFRNVGLGSLRIGGGSVEESVPAGTGRDGFTGIDNLFAFAAAAQVTVIYSLRLLSPSARPIAGLEKIGARVAGYIWDRYPERVASFCVGNEPDWHAFHTYDGHPLDPAIYEENPGVPGSAYAPYRSGWQRFAGAVSAAAPGAPLAGPDTGAYSPLTYTPDPESGVSWTQRFAADERASGRATGITQHYYVGGSPGRTTARQAIRNMLSPEWVTGTAIGSQPARTTYTPYPWMYSHNLAPVLAAGLRYRLTESNDYLTGVPGASNAFASALWALDYLHWWAAHGAAGVNFHNKQWLYTDTIVPEPGGAAGRFAISPKGYGIKAFTLGAAGRPRPVTIGNPDAINLTAYCVGGPDQVCVTIINKAHGPGAAAAAVTIVPPGAGWPRAQVITLDSGEPGNPGAASATLGGAAITGDTRWQGEWRALPTGPAGAAPGPGPPGPGPPGPGISLAVPATSAAIVRLQRAG